MAAINRVRLLARTLCIARRPLGYCTKVQYRSLEKSNILPSAYESKLQVTAGIELFEKAGSERWVWKNVQRGFLTHKEITKTEQKKMNQEKSNMKGATSLLFVLLAGLLLAGCSQTAAPEPNLIQRATGETPAAPPPTGFLGNDYSLLTPPAEGTDQKAMLRYVNQNANWGNYNKILIAPVTYWAADDSRLSAADQQALCNYMYGVLTQDVAKTFIIVDEPGPGVIKLSAALTDATSAVPVLRSVSVVVPQARALSLIKMAATGTYAFVGSAQGAIKLNDSMSGQLLAAAVDKRVGGTAVTNVAVWQWGDAEHAMDYWGNLIDQRLVAFGVQPSSSTSASN